ncbi:MAG: hypothetical protein FWD19_05970, partial [Defluviitaleaceae bacterium]|nr:hypothetical protein [Defluviitaleaceae bacterium]
AGAGAIASNESENNFADTTSPNEPAPVSNDFVAPEFIFLRILPDGWKIISTDFDGDLTIFHLESGAGNSVVVLAGEPIYDDRGGEFRQVFINEHPAFMLLEDSHSILFFDVDGFQFVLSTNGAPAELFVLAERWL